VRLLIQLRGTVTDQPSKVPKPIVVWRLSTVFTVPRSECSPKIRTSTLSFCLIFEPLVGSFAALHLACAILQSRCEISVSNCSNLSGHMLRPVIRWRRSAAPNTVSHRLRRFSSKSLSTNAHCHNRLTTNRNHGRSGTSEHDGSLWRSSEYRMGRSALACLCKTIR
jgi:hypothetical protein